MSIEKDNGAEDSATLHFRSKHFCSKPQQKIAVINLAEKNQFWIEQHSHKLIAMFGQILKLI